VNGYYLSGYTTAQLRLIKTCLGDADGTTANNVDVYNWDYGSLNNPHLIKLQDATQYQLPVIYDLDGDDPEYDEALRQVPKTQLCTSMAGNPQRFGVDGNGIGYCANANPPGFYAVTYFDGTNFRLMTNPGKDYSTTTTFYLYTTSGYLQVVSLQAKVFTTTAAFDNLDKAMSYHSNLLYSTNSTSTNINYFGDMSCENGLTANGLQNGLLDCLDKGDLVMILDTVTNSKNPRYPNIYTVEKVSLEEKIYSSSFPNPTDLFSRQRIHLNYGMNKNYLMAADTARIFKFYPQNPMEKERTKFNYGGYPYAGECSMRGNCNADNGLCECFNGYTGDNCGIMNALAQ
jgi:hypothetical protein